MQKQIITNINCLANVHDKTHVLRGRELRDLPCIYNAYLINEDGTPNTAHTMNPVPFFIIDKEWRGKIKPGKLADIAPTILTMMDLPIPKEMTGEILIDKP